MAALVDPSRSVDEIGMREKRSADTSARYSGATLETLRITEWSAGQDSGSYLVPTFFGPSKHSSPQGARARYSSYRAGFAHSSPLFWSTCSRATVDSHSSIVPHHDPKSKHAFELRQTAHFKIVLLFYNCFKGRCRHRRSHSSLRFFSPWPTYPRIVCTPHPGSTVTYRGPSQIPDLSINPSGTGNGTLVSAQAYFVRLHLRTFYVFFAPHACLPPHNPILPPSAHEDVRGWRAHDVGDESEKQPSRTFRTSPIQRTARA
ncbi:hypothetical protein B0H13DRAFT_1884220 [Mycena leptocephala]|nr:hypothetical protein B0H13DRAFT_1884220 [Mycena leptocephala]